MSHMWILECLGMYSIDRTLRAFIKSSTRLWKTTHEANSTSPSSAECLKEILCPHCSSVRFPALYVCLDVHGFWLFLSPACFFSRVSEGHQGLGVDCLWLVFPIQLTSQDLPYSLQIFGSSCFTCDLFVISLCLWDSKVLEAGLNILDMALCYYHPLSSDYLSSFCCHLTTLLSPILVEEVADGGSILLWAVLMSTCH